ncbi:hypothetical protein [Levilactobacillus phage ENFP1]|nr:hypothetical protein [Levilactobacillus phage ENFP1]
MENISKKDAIKGYKVFDDDWTCNDKFYKVGETSHEDKVKLGNSGMHFCTKLSDCFEYYRFYRVRVAEVEGYGYVEKSEWDSKVTCSELKVIRELTFPKSNKLAKALDEHYHISDRINRGIIKEENMLQGVKHVGYNIVYFPNPSEEIQLAAVKQNPDAINYIDKPSEAVKDYVNKFNNNLPNY